MLPIDGRALVLWVHVLSACIWIGGQIIVAAVIPMARRIPGLAPALGRRFQTVAWPAFGLLVITGIINVGDSGIGWSGLTTTDTGRTLLVKLILVAGSGAAAAVHAFLQARRAPSAALSAMLGSASAGLAIFAALFGVVLAGG